MAVIKLTLSLFLVLKEFGLNIYYSFLYCILFSILAYPSSGTPFVDHHSAFFSLLGIFSLILGIRLEKKIEVLEIDETPAYGLETKLQIGINGVVECTSS